MNFETGATVGDYEILETLGAGGMGKVFKVRNRISNRIEAMKILLPDIAADADLADRFIREIQVHASLQHAHIATLHTALHANNQLLMLMEYVEGTTLAALGKKGALPVCQVIEFGAQVLDALAYAHEKGIVHRDLKPSNLMLTPQGVVKLLDFGIARMAEQPGLTRTGRTVGSLFYMSPEQIENSAAVDARSDLYSLGVCLYELATGSRPFAGDSDYSVMAAHLHGAPVPPIERAPGLPVDLNRIILMSIEKDPGRRFQSANAMRTALREVANGLGTAQSEKSRPAKPSAAPVEPLPIPPPAAAKSSPTLYIVLGAVLSLAVLVVGAFQIPRIFKARAEGEAPKQEAVTPPRAPVRAHSEAPPASVPEPATGQETATVPIPQTATSIPAPKPRESAAPLADARPAEMPAAAQSEPPAQTPRVDASDQSGTLAAVATPAVEAEVSGEIRELREHLMLLATRSGAVRTTVTGLQRNQARAGLGLRGDITASMQRMEYYLDEMESAMKRNDAAAAKKYLDSAEREISRLESFLGR